MTCTQVSLSNDDQVFRTSKGIEPFCSMLTLKGALHVAAKSLAFFFHFLSFTFFLRNGTNLWIFNFKDRKYDMLLLP